MKYGFLKAFLFFILLCLAWAEAAAGSEEMTEEELVEMENREMGEYYGDQVRISTRTMKPLSQQAENIETNTSEDIERKSAPPVPGEPKRVPP